MSDVQENTQESVKVEPVKEEKKQEPVAPVEVREERKPEPKRAPSEKKFNTDPTADDVLREVIFKYPYLIFFNPLSIISVVNKKRF